MIICVVIVILWKKEMKVGEQVLEYVLDRQLGSGGFGEVFHAVHPVLGQEVAVKRSG